jgi:ribosome-associated protein
VVHVFDPDTRDYYALEDLWADAPRLDWKRA